jgi:adenylylsulfate kinase-like enzyme
MSWAIWITRVRFDSEGTLAEVVAHALESRGVRVRLLDADEVARTLAPAPGQADLVPRALAYMAMLLTEAGVAVLIEAEGRCRAGLELARRLIPAFAEVRVEPAAGAEARGEEIVLRSDTCDHWTLVQEVLHLARRLSGVAGALSLRAARRLSWP